MATPPGSPRARLGIQGNTRWRAGFVSLLAALAAPAGLAQAQTAPPRFDAPAGPQPPPAEAPAQPPSQAPAEPPPPPPVVPAQNPPAAAPPPGYAPYPPPGYYPYPAPPPGGYYPYAQPYTPGWPPPPAAPSPTVAASTTPQIVAIAPLPPSSGRTPAEDPQADRVVLLPTAYTHPQGTFYASSYEIILLQAGYAFTDSTQVTLTVLPVTQEAVAIIDLTLKSALVQGGRVRVALLGSASGAVGRDIGVQLFGRAGGVVQLCADAPCGSSLSLSTNVLLLGGTVAMANGVGAIVRAGRIVSLLGELSTLIPVGTQGGQFNGSVIGGGVRFHWPHIGFDLALLRFLDSATATLPFVSFTYRS